MAVSPDDFSIRQNIPDLRKRRGKFVVPATLIDNAPELVMKLMTKVIIVRAEHMYYNGSIEYMALSPDFPIVDEGVMTPEITVNAARDEHGGWHISFGLSEKDKAEVDRYEGIL